MAYATYVFYRDVYLGDSIPEDLFSYFAEKASAYIDEKSFFRAAKYAGEHALLQKACCAVAEAMKLNEEGGGVVSESVGSVSRNYAAGISNTPTEAERLEDALCRYLVHTGLLYLGVE